MVDEPKAKPLNPDATTRLIEFARACKAAAPFFYKLLKGQGREPRRLITDKLRSYAAAHRTVMPSVVHSTRHDENNRVEVSPADPPARATDASV